MKYLWLTTILILKCGAQKAQKWYKVKKRGKSGHTNLTGNKTGLKLE